MDAYLLDTNLVSTLYDSRRPDYQQVVSTVASLDPDAPQLVSAVTIAELRFGLALYAATGNPLTHIEACIRQAEEHPLLEVGKHTAQAFAEVKSRVALQRLNVASRIPRWVEDWSDRVTSQKLQVDENDLWIAAQALERNLVVVTSDTDFNLVIAAAVPDLRVQLV